MAKKTFFGQLILTIQTFFVGLLGSEKKVEEFLAIHANEGIEAAQKFRDFLKGPTLDIAKGIIDALVANHTSIDTGIDKYRDILTDRITKVIEKMVGAQACLQLPTFEERFLCFAELIRKQTPDATDADVFKFASLFTKQSAADAGITVKTSATDTAVQMQLYKNKIDLGTA